ncbi:MAG TPA: bifunctional phosphopantothenoylcysteine decarboxylase/phosphopantothenate synthase, partial [Rhizobiales bacterium]|nr:bifunctional phosphopantothenoylcysteine decarboxylase/phosphopantothenate synthase [Hyphomicrobiales bacterium]
PVRIADPLGVKTVHVETAADMLAAVEGALPADIAIFAAAVADWRMREQSREKMKKTATDNEMSLDLVQNPDILKLVSRGHLRPPLVIGFAAETRQVVANAAKKRQAKGCDWIVANDVSEGTGIMGGDNNRVSLVTKSRTEDWPEMTKDKVAEKLIARAAEHLTAREAAAE